MLDFRIATFLSVCRTLNYTRSAEELSITQPAVSQHIAQLEQRLGVKLFERHGRTLVLTAAGQRAREVAEAMTHDERLLREELRALDGDEPLLAVGVTLTAGEYLTADALGRYLAERPAARMTIVEGDTQDLVALLRSGAIDCAFVEGAFDATAFQARPLCRQRLVGVCAPTSSVARRRSIMALEDLVDERLIVRERGSGTRVMLERALFDRNLTIASFARMVEASSINIIKRLVAQGAGISFLYEAAVARELSDGTLARIALVDELIEHDIAFIHLKDSAYSEQLARFCDDVVALRGDTN